jgi:hypothetical protein
MKVAGLREMEVAAPALPKGGEPVLVTREGKVSGLYVPLEDPARIPDDLRRDLISAVGRHLAGVLEEKGVSEKEILGDFDAFRRLGCAPHPPARGREDGETC